MPLALETLIRYAVRARLAFWLLGGLAIASGFGWKTPAAKFREIDVRVGRIEQVQADAANSQEEIKRTLRALSIAQCLDKPRWKTELMELPCDDLLAGKLANPGALASRHK
jgi:hypothetical protein